MLCQALTEEYYVGRTIGRGSQGAVRVLKDKINSSVVLCKEFNFTDLDDAAFTSLMEDLSLASNLEHQSLIHYDRLIIHDDTQTIFAITSQIANCNLNDFMQRHRDFNLPIPEACVLTILRSVAQALSFLHKEARPLLFAKVGGEYTEDPVLHNDLKPSNVLIMENNHVIVTDYGMSRTYKMKRLASTFSSSLAYIAPEVLQRKEPTGASDIWSLGCIIYELCSLKRLIERANTVAEVSSYLSSLKDIVIPKSYSKQLSKLLKQMLSIDEKARPTVSDILAIQSVQAARLNVQMEHLLNSTVKAYRTTNIPNITVQMDLNSCDVITASSSVYGETSSSNLLSNKRPNEMLSNYGSGVNGISGGSTTSKSSTRPSSTAMGRLHARSIKASRSLASSVAFNKSLITSSARLDMCGFADSTAEARDLNNNGTLSLPLYLATDTVIQDSAQASTPSVTGQNDISMQYVKSDASLSQLMDLKRSVCADMSNRRTVQDPLPLPPVPLSDSATSGKDDPDILLRSEAVDASKDRATSICTTTTRFSGETSSVATDSARLSVRLPNSIRRAVSTRINTNENTRARAEYMTEFISESRRRLQLLDSICLTRYTTSPQPFLSHRMAPLSKQSVLSTPTTRNTLQNFSSPSFTLDISHPDNIKKVTDDLTNSSIEVLVPNRSISDIPNLSKQSDRLEGVDDGFLTPEPFINAEKSEASSDPQPPGLVKTSLTKLRGVSRRKTERVERAEQESRQAASTNEQLNDALLSKLGSSIIAKKLGSDSAKKGRRKSTTNTPELSRRQSKAGSLSHGTPPSVETSVSMVASKIAEKALTSDQKQRQDSNQSQSQSQDAEPDVSTTIAAKMKKGTPKYKFGMMRSRSKSTALNNISTLSVNTIPECPRLSLPSDTERQLLNACLGDGSSLSMELSTSTMSTSTSTSTNRNPASGIYTPRKLEIPKVPVITVQRREHIRQKTAMPMTAAIDSSSGDNLSMPLSGLQSRKKTFVPSPPPLSKPYLVEKVKPVVVDHSL